MCVYLLIVVDFKKKVYEEIRKENQLINVYKGILNFSLKI